jgi:hypothetical protein
MSYSHIADMIMLGITGDRLTAEILSIRLARMFIMCTEYSERIYAKESEALSVPKYKKIDR